MAIYKSETTHFFEKIKQENPELEQNQIQGHNLLREKPLNLKEIEEKQQSLVKQKSYVYGS